MREKREKGKKGKREDHERKREDNKASALHCWMC